MRRKRIVTIGGGTGNFILLSGLKNYPVEISAIVSMADDGGSTGILRDELGVLPPGDVRQCLVALSDSSNILRKLLVYRFESGGLKGHNFGNLFLSALEKISGNFEKAVDEARKILGVESEIIPATNQDVRLFLELRSGKILRKEDEINQSDIIQKEGFKKIYFQPSAEANPRAVKKIMEADMVIIGPGGHYTSILPNIAIKGIADAIRKTKAKVVYNCNLTNKKGQTEGFELDDYIDAICGFIGRSSIDYAVFNHSDIANDALVKKYERKKQALVEFHPEARKSRNYKVVLADVVDEKPAEYSKADVIASTRAFIRHDSGKTARLLMALSKNIIYDSIIKKII